ncbi:MAG: phosphotransferase [Alphaproteobacteria bacterium]
MEKKIDRSREQKDFLALHGWGHKLVTPLRADASKRTYYRLGSEESEMAILMDCPPAYDSVVPFVTIATILHNMGYSSPKIIAQDPKQGFLILEDFGHLTFTNYLKAATDATALYEAAVDVLIDLHKKWDQVPAEKVPPYNLEKFLTESALFIDWYYPKIMGHKISEKAAEEWQKIWTELLSPLAHKPFLVLRDYHVDNLMWLPHRKDLARCGLLDFQDAALGPRSYDLVSLLEDARLDVSPALQHRMLQRYLDAFPELDQDEFLQEYYILGAQRNSKIIGIFSRLAFRDHKTHYLSFIPRVWALLEGDLKHASLHKLKDWFDHHIPRENRKVPT